MATRMQSITLVYNEDETKLLERQNPEPPHRFGSATLVFHLAEQERVRHPHSVVALLNAEGIDTGTVVARNPINYDHWWIPVTILAHAGRPYCEGPGLGREYVAQGPPRPASQI